MKINLKIKKENFKKKLGVKDGKTPTKVELEAIIVPLIPKPIKGDKGDDGEDISPELVENLNEQMEELKKEFEEKMEDIKKVVSSIPRGGSNTVGTNALKYAMNRAVLTETPSGLLNGSNTDYSVTSTIHAVLGFMLNGEAVALSNYSITGSYRKTISFTTALPSDYSGKDFEIIYI